MCCFYHTSNTINLVTASIDASIGIVEHTILIPDVVDCSAPTHGVIFAKYVAQITKQQSRYAVGHRVLLFRSQAASQPTLANFMTFVVATLAGRTRGPARERMWVLLKMPIFRLLSPTKNSRS
jgi:hypothetical protein